MSGTKKSTEQNTRIIRVSEKRQITIPMQYFKSLGFGDQVECSMEDGALVIRPLTRNNSEFSVEILKDLMSQGYSGDELIRKFTEQSLHIQKAVQSLLEEADDIASGKQHSVGMEDVFGDKGDV